MASVAAMRSISRSGVLRNAAAKIAGEARAARPSLCSSPRQRPAFGTQFLRHPVEMSCSVESLLPLHSAIASSRMTSLLSVSRFGYGWVSQDGTDDN